jgi:hypothetical protein
VSASLSSSSSSRWPIWPCRFGSPFLDGVLISSSTAPLWRSLSGRSCLGILAGMTIFLTTLYGRAGNAPALSHLSLQSRGDGLHLGVVLEHFLAHLASPAGLFISAKG